jgi:putative addiction module antidote
VNRAGGILVSGIEAVDALFVPIFPDNLTKSVRAVENGMLSRRLTKTTARRYSRKRVLMDSALMRCDDKEYKVMILQKTRRSGNSLAVTIPKEVVEELGLHEGDMVALEINKATVQVEMRPHVREAFEAVMREYAADIAYLADK